MLQNSVDNAQDLRQVHINAAHAQSEGQPEMMYQKYIPLLLPAAEAHDTSLSQTKVTKHQQVFVHDIDYQSSYDVEENIKYNVDTYLDYVTSIHQPIQIRNTRVKNSNMNHKRNFIPKSDWLQIPEDIYAKLVKNKSVNQSKNNHCTVQNTNIDDHLIIDTDNGNDNEDGIHYPDTNLIDAIVNNVTIDDNMIQQVMNTHSSPNNKQLDEIVHNGTRYRKLNMMRITYRIRKIFFTRLWCKRRFIWKRHTYITSYVTMSNHYLDRLSSGW
jgi:hypothetical protein